MTPALLAVFGTFVLVSVSLWFAGTTWMTAASPEKRRLRALMQAPGVRTVTVDQGLVAHNLDPFLARLSALLPAQSASRASDQRLRMTRAGWDTAGAVVYFACAQVVLPALAAAGTLVVAGFDGWAYAIPAAAVGFLLPNLYVDHRIRARQRAIRNALPDALDLLTLCVEAGGGLDQAIAKTADELQIAHPLLSDQLRMMTTEIRAGRPRLEAFHNFSARTGIDEVRTLVSMLTQTDRFGTSIGQALRTHADTARTIRRQEAEERAAKVSVKLVFPLALCLFPPLYVAAFGPVAIRVFRAFQ